MESINPTPYTAEELYEKANGVVERFNIPEKWRDDAIQEFVIAAWQAGEKSKPNPRAYQIAMGKGAIQHFVRHEAMMENLGPGTCSRYAARVSFDMPVAGMAGEPTTLAETIVDENAPAPDVQLLRAERDSAVRGALAQLTPDQRVAATATWIDGATQEDVTKAMGKSRQEVRTLLAVAKQRLALMLGDHQLEFTGTRRG